MSAFLSEQWRAELADTLADADPIVAGPRLALGQMVTGAPWGDVSYTIVVGGGDASQLVEGVDVAAVVLVEQYDVALAIASGAPSANMLAEGRVKVRGDVGKLIEAEAVLAQLTPVLAAFAEASGAAEGAS